jgi:hypothetical protein
MGSPGADGGGSGAADDPSAALAVDTLAEAVSAGFHDTRRLESDTCWEPLRAHAGFLQLVAQLEPKIPAESGGRP